MKYNTRLQLIVGAFDNLVYLLFIYDVHDRHDKKSIHTFMYTLNNSILDIFQ